MLNTEHLKNEKTETNTNQGATAQMCHCHLGILPFTLPVFFSPITEPTHVHCKIHITTKRKENPPLNPVPKNNHNC